MFEMIAIVMVAVLMLGLYYAIDTALENKFSSVYLSGYYDGYRDARNNKMREPSTEDWLEAMYGEPDKVCMLPDRELEDYEWNEVK